MFGLLHMGPSGLGSLFPRVECNYYILVFGPSDAGDVASMYVKLEWRDLDCVQLGCAGCLDGPA